MHAMRIGPKAQLSDERGSPSKRLTRTANVRLEMFRERYQFLPDDHPKVQYIRGLPVLREHPDIEVLVTSNWNDENALAFANRKIVVSDRTLQNATFREEIEFILQHELTHITENHAEKLKGIAGRRLDEMYADLKKVLKDDNSSVNPAGGLALFERLDSAGHAYDPVHGSSSSRLVGLEYLIRMIDLRSLRANMKKIPKSLKRVEPFVKTEYDEIDYTLRFEFMHFWGDEQLEIVKGLSLRAALYALPEAYIVRRSSPAARKFVLAMEENIQAKLSEYIYSEDPRVRTALTSVIFSSLGAERSLKDVCSGLIDDPKRLELFASSLQNLPPSFPLIATTRLDDLYWFFEGIAFNYDERQNIELSTQLIQGLRHFEETFYPFDQPDFLKEEVDYVIMGLLDCYDSGRAIQEFVEEMRSYGITPGSEVTVQLIGDHFNLEEEGREWLKETYSVKADTEDLHQEIPHLQQKMGATKGLIERFQRKDDQDPRLLFREVLENVCPTSVEELADFIVQYDSFIYSKAREKQ